MDLQNQSQVALQGYAQGIHWMEARNQQDFQTSIYRNETTFGKAFCSSSNNRIRI